MLTKDVSPQSLPSCSTPDLSQEHSNPSTPSLPSLSRMQSTPHLSSPRPSTPHCSSSRASTPHSSSSRAISPTSASQESEMHVPPPPASIQLSNSFAIKEKLTSKTDWLRNFCLPEVVRFCYITVYTVASFT